MSRTRLAARNPWGLTDSDIDWPLRPQLPAVEYIVRFGLSDADVFTNRSVSAHSLAQSAFATAIQGVFLTTTRGQLLELLQLPRGWDGYGGVPVMERVAEYAIRVLSQVLERGAPHPTLVPTSDGGLNLEWHAPDADLVIAIEPNEPVLAFFDDRTSGTTWERELSSAVAGLDSAIGRFAAE